MLNCGVQERDSVDTLSPRALWAEFPGFSFCLCISELELKKLETQKHQSAQIKRDAFSYQRPRKVDTSKAEFFSFLFFPPHPNFILFLRRDLTSFLGLS